MKRRWNVMDIILFQLNVLMIMMPFNFLKQFRKKLKVLKFSSCIIWCKKKHDKASPALSSLSSMNSLLQPTCVKNMPPTMKQIAVENWVLGWNQSTRGDSGADQMVKKRRGLLLKSALKIKGQASSSSFISGCLWENSFVLNWETVSQVGSDTQYHEHMQCSDPLMLMWGHHQGLFFPSKPPETGFIPAGNYAYAKQLLLVPCVHLAYWF